MIGKLSQPYPSLPAKTFANEGTTISTNERFICTEHK